MAKAATRHKAENGVGSVKPYRDMWRGRATVSLLNGEPKRLQVYGKTYAEARERLNKEIQAAQRGTLTDQKITVGDYLSVWLERNGKGLKPTTLTKYQDATQKLVKHLPKVRLDKLTPVQAETALSAIQADTMVRFLTVAQQHRLYPLLRLAFETGMRRGELLGLHWDDVDFLRHKIYVRHNLVKAGKALHLYDTKSESGDRDIDLDPTVMGLLREHHLRQDKERENVGDIWAHSELVFVSEIGTYINPDNITRLIKGLCKTADVPYKSIHKMRHTSLSLYHASGATPAELSYRAGHSRISTTTDIYIHTTDQRTPFSIDAVLERLKDTTS